MSEATKKLETNKQFCELLIMIGQKYEIQIDYRIDFFLKNLILKIESEL